MCSQLASVEKMDQTVWSLFIEPNGAIQDLATFARTASKENTDSYRAYSIIKMAAQHISLKNLLSIPDQLLQKDRNFRIEVTQLLNNVNNTNRTLQPDSKQLVPLGKALDHAAAALVRIESLRTNYNFSQGHQQEYSRESVTVYYEEALRQITDLTERDLLATVREKADADTVVMLQLFEAQQFVEALKNTCRDYVKRLVAEDQTKTLALLKAEFAESPLQFEEAEKTEAGPLPAEFLKASDLGEIFDAVCEYVCAEAWSVMGPAHNPQNVIPEVIAILRELVAGSLSFEPERRRHQERAGIALAVVSLDKVSGNANLKDLYVRVSEEGQIHYVENFEDGTYVDLFELREYKPVRLASAAKKKAEEQGTEQLQTGRKYLSTLGRTNQLFADMPADIINSCVRGEDGGPKMFPAF